MFRDKVIVGGIIGVVADIAMDLFQYPMWKLDIVKHPLSHYAASLFLDPQALHHTMIGSIVSFLADYIYAALLGILFVYMAGCAGKRHWLAKGLIFGAVLWLVSFGGLRALPIVKLRQVIPEQVVYYLFFHLVFGAALGWLWQAYRERLADD